MNEAEVRQFVVSTAKKYLGCKESDESHKKIIDTYNKHKPLAMGYKVKYTDSWCATFVSFVAIMCKYTDIMPTECSCPRMVTQYKNLGRWVEDDSYKPKIGDIIMYDWSDNGKGDNQGNPDHVGIVAAISGDNMTIIEGNKNDSVSYRELKVNGKYIRGYCVPKYSAKATKEPVKASVFGNDFSKVDSAEEYSSAIFGKYIATADLNMRTGAGTGKEVITVIPKGTSVNCCGFHTIHNGIKWYIVIFEREGKVYVGFASGNYLKNK